MPAAIPAAIPAAMPTAMPALMQPQRPAIDAPYDGLAPLPRTVWLPAVVTSAGNAALRIGDTARWLAALEQGELPPSEADFGDPAAAPVLRAAVGELGLPALCRGVPALAEQVLRTLLWHLDRIVDHQPRLSREEAIDEVTREVRLAWRDERASLEEDLALLQGLGDLEGLRWDELRGHLHSRPWAEARQAAERLRRLPQLVDLIRRLGRAERDAAALPAPAPQPEPAAEPPAPLAAVHTRLPDAPGEITGIRFTSRIESMLAAEAAMLRHPTGRRLWRARHAEARLLGWQTQAELVDWRPDPLAASRAPVSAVPPLPLARGPIILCLDTSGSMRGAPERIAKAVVLAAVRAAHDNGRACLLLAFGGPGEVVERPLGADASGLQALMDTLGQAFDGGTDVQTPIERAIERVHHSAWRSADLLIVSDGEFGCMPATLDRLDEARERLGLRVHGVLVGDRETIGLLEVCDHIHWERDWRRFAEAGEASEAAARRDFSPVHSKSLTALYFPNALSARAARHHN